MFQIVAVLATLALAQADPLSAYAYGGYGAAYGGAHVAAHAPVALGHHDLGFAGHGFAGHGFAGHGFAGHGFGLNHHEAQPFLSCYEKNYMGSIAVNIKPRTYGYGLAGYGAGVAGLEATINVHNDAFSDDVIISFTEQSNANQGTNCNGADYGNFIGPSSYEHTDDHSDDNDHGFGHGFGFGYGYGHHTKAMAPSVAHTTIADGMMASFHIDHLEGFTSMDQLAGRGVIVCLKTYTKLVDGHWACVTTRDDDPSVEDNNKIPLACCNLHYSAKGDSLSSDGSQHTEAS